MEGQWGRQCGGGGEGLEEGWERRQYVSAFQYFAVNMGAFTNNRERWWRGAPVGVPVLHRQYGYFHKQQIKVVARGTCRRPSTSPCRPCPP